LEKLQALESEKSTLVEAARVELVEKIDLDPALLKNMGFHYKLIEMRNNHAPLPHMWLQDG
jgi:hypothetical protein